MKVKRIISAVLTIAMLMTSIVFTASAATVDNFTDFPSDSHWSAPALKAAVANNILRGKGNGLIDGEGYLTRAEMAAIIVRAFGATIPADISAYKDLDPNEWYYSEFAKAVHMQVFEGDGDGTMRPNGNITREEAFVVFARAMVLDEGDTSSLNKFSDASSVSDWAKGLLATVVAKRYVNGDDLGRLNPGSYITREEFAQFMHNMFKTYYSVNGTYKSANPGGVVVRTPNATIENVTIDGDLVIADGCGEGTIYLTNVIVKGRILIRGAAKVVIRKTTVEENIVVKNINSTVHFDNYRTESVFDGLVAHTPVTFKGHRPSGGGGSPVVTNADYTVKYYLQKTTLDGYDEVVADKVTTSGVVGSTVNATINSYPHFVHNAAISTTSGVVAADGSLVLNVYYDRETFTVVFDSNGGDSVVPAFITVAYGCEYGALPTATRNGYIFDGWFTEAEGGTEIINTTVVDLTSNITLYAHWSPVPVGTANYKVKYYKQNTLLNGYVEVTADEFNSFDTIGTTVYAPDKAYENFELNTSLSVQSGTVLADGSLVLEMYYDRKVYTVTFDANGGTVSIPSKGFAYGTTYGDLPVPTRDGYIFDGWYTAPVGGTRIEGTTVVDITSATTVYAHWTQIPSNHALYTVEYYQQNIELGDNYTRVDIIQSSATIGSTVDAVVKTYPGFVLNTVKSILSGEVLADGSLVLRVYYDRQTVTVTFHNDDKVTVITIPANSVVSEADFPADSWTQYGYVKNSQVSHLYDTEYVHTVDFGWWYNPTTSTWEKFTSGTIVTKDTDVYLTSQELAIRLIVDGYQVDFAVYYEDGTRFADTVKDLLTIDKNKVLTLISLYEDKALKLPLKYGIIDDQRTLLTQDIFVRLAKVIGEDRLESYIRDEASQLLTTDEQMRESIIEYLEHCLTEGTPDELETAENLVRNTLKKAFDADPTLFGTMYDEYVGTNFRTLYNALPVEAQEIMIDKLVENDDVIVKTLNKITSGSYTKSDLSTPAFKIINLLIKNKITSEDDVYEQALTYIPYNSYTVDNVPKYTKKFITELVLKAINNPAVTPDMITDTVINDHLADISVRYSTVAELPEYTRDFIANEVEARLATDMDGIFTTLYEGYIYPEFELLATSSTVGLNASAVKAITIEKLIKTIVYQRVEENNLSFIDLVDPATIKPIVVDSFNNDPVIRTNAIEYIVDFFEDPDHVNNLDEYLHHALEYLDEHPTEREEITEYIIDNIYSVELDRLVYELINNDKFTVNGKDLFILKGLKRELETQFSFDTLVSLAFGKASDKLPDNVEGKLPKELEEIFFEIYPKDKARELYDRTMNPFMAQVNDAIAKIEADPNYIAEIDSGVMIIVNPITDIYVPLYESAMVQIQDKLEDKFYYGQNLYLRELVDMLSPEKLFINLGNGLYRIRTNEEYYDMILKAAILADDAVAWYKNNLTPDQVYNVIAKYQDFIIKYANIATELANDYIDNGTIPSKLDKNPVRRIEKIIWDKYPELVEKIFDKYQNSELNKEFTANDFEKLRKAIRLAFEKTDITTNEVLDLVMKKDSDGIYSTTPDSISKSFKNISVMVRRMFYVYE